MLTLVLESTVMLGLDVHVDSALILLSKVAVRTLELTSLGADIFECHGVLPKRWAENSIFCWQK